jgi:uncharacterized protein YqgV (UPF0045/DUF77 family)
MIHNRAVDTSKVLVELSVIPLGGYHEINKKLPLALEITEKDGLFFEQQNNTICIEGEWNKISEFIHKCYERVQAYSPQGFLQVSIR